MLFGQSVVCARSHFEGASRFRGKLSKLCVVLRRAVENRLGLMVPAPMVEIGAARLPGAGLALCFMTAVPRAQGGEERLKWVAATRRACCLIVVAHHRYLASTRAGSISIAWKASVTRGLTVICRDRQADWQSRQVGKDGCGSLRRQTMVEMRMDTALAVPPSGPSLLIVPRLCFAACQHLTSSGEGGIAFVRKYDGAPSMTAACCVLRAACCVPHRLQPCRRSLAG